MQGGKGPEGLVCLHPKGKGLTGSLGLEAGVWMSAGSCCNLEFPQLVGASSVSQTLVWKADGGEEEARLSVSLPPSHSPSLNVLRPNLRLTKRILLFAPTLMGRGGFLLWHFCLHLAPEQSPAAADHDGSPLSPLWSQPQNSIPLLVELLELREDLGRRDSLSHKGERSNTYKHSLTYARVKVHEPCASPLSSLGSSYLTRSILNIHYCTALLEREKGQYPSSRHPQPGQAVSLPLARCARLLAHCSIL